MEQDEEIRGGYRQERKRVKKLAQNVHSMISL